MNSAQSAGVTAAEGARRFRALGDAMSAAIRKETSAAQLRSSIALIVVAFVGGVIDGWFGLTDSLQLRAPTIIVAATVLILVTSLVAGVSLHRSLRGRLGDAIDVLTWGAREAQREWAGASPDAAGVPRTPVKAQEWLASHPETPENLPQRLTAQMMIGEVEAARDTLSRYPTDTAYKRHRRAIDELTIDVIEDAPLLARKFEVASADLGDEHRLHAVVCLAAFKAFVAALSGGDWLGTLAAARPALPEDATALGRRQLWLRSTTLHVGIVAALVGALAAVLLIVLG